jgi:hypothetical protein
MNVVLFHSTDNVPKHIEYCVKQIKHFTPDVKIHFLTDKNAFSNNVNIVNINDLNLNFDHLPYYKNDQMPLWRTSALRFFYIEEFIRRANLNDVFHFDNDILIYEDLNLILKNIKDSKFLITRHKETEAVCGFVYIKDYNSISGICRSLLEYMHKNEKELESQLGSMPHEMRLLGQIFNESKLISEFPILPWWKNFDKFNSVFDPSSYGQYICYNKMIHEGSKNRFIDTQILNNKIKVEFDNQLKVPFIYFNDFKIKINNLHIHCKNLQDYISY